MRWRAGALRQRTFEVDGLQLLGLATHSFNAWALVAAWGGSRFYLYHVDPETMSTKRVDSLDAWLRELL